MEKSKKANECRNNLIVGIKVAKLQCRVPVASQLWVQKKVKKLPLREIVANQIGILSSKKEFEKQKTLLFGVNFE